MADAYTKTDEAILKGGMHAPIVHGDFTIYEVSIHSPSQPDAASVRSLELNHISVFQELNIFEDLFSNVL